MMKYPGGGEIWHKSGFDGSVINDRWTVCTGEEFPLLLDAEMETSKLWYMPSASLIVAVAVFPLSEGELIDTPASGVVIEILLGGVTKPLLAEMVSVNDPVVCATLLVGFTVTVMSATGLGGACHEQTKGVSAESIPVTVPLDCLQIMMVELKPREVPAS